MDTLPADVLTHVFGFWRSHEFCTVSERWSQLVHLKHTRTPPRFNLKSQVKISVWNSIFPRCVFYGTRQLVLRMTFLEENVTNPVFDQIFALPHLEFLDLNFAESYLFPYSQAPTEDSVGHFIQCAKAHGRVSTLKMNLRGYYEVILSGIITTICEIGTIASLRTLHLNLSDNGLDDPDLSDLGQLPSNSHFTELNLQLAENQFTNEGLVEFGKSFTSSTLTSFALDLSNCGIPGGHDFAFLDGLSKFPRLNEFSLNVQNTGSRAATTPITREKASRMVASLNSCLNLKRLSLTLSGCDDHALRCLAELGHVARLKEIRLILRCNFRITDKGGKWLQKLKESEQLDALHLEVFTQNMPKVSLSTLKELQRAPSHIKKFSCILPRK